MKSLLLTLDRWAFRMWAAAYIRKNLVDEDSLPGLYAHCVERFWSAVHRFIDKHTSALRDDIDGAHHQ